MEEELITKKELLEITGISYGALYRWKRKNLIPDEWFIHKSTFTGQETFFPKQKILERVERIKHLKDGMSLDDIAETFSPVLREISLTPAETERYRIASRGSIELYMQIKGSSGPYDYEKLFEIYLFDHLLKSGDLGRDDAIAALSLASEGFQQKREESVRLIVYRKLGVAFNVMVEENASVRGDVDAKVVLSISIGKLTSELKQILDRGK